MFRLSKRYNIHPIFLTVFFIGLLISAAVAFGYMVESLKLFQSFDRSVYVFFRSTWHPAWLDLIIIPFNFNFISLGGPQFLNFLVVIIFASLVYIYFFRRKEFHWALLGCGLAGLFDVFLAFIIPIIFFRPRPFLSIPTSISNVAANIWQALPSYPSGHVRSSAIFLTVIAAFLPKKMRLPFVLFVIFIAFSRVFVGAHYPSDVFAGMIIGYLAGKIVLSVIEEIKITKQESRKIMADNKKITTYVKDKINL